MERFRQVVSHIEFQAIRIDTCSDDAEGRLILVGGRLVGVLVRLDAAEQAPLGRYWSLEVGFGPLAPHKPEPFKDLDAARAWTECIMPPKQVRRGSADQPAMTDPIVR